MGIRELPSGRWRLQIRRAKLNVDETFDTRSEAQAALDRLTEAAKTGTSRPRGTTIEEAWQLYLGSRDHAEKRDNTRRGELTHARPLLAAMGQRLIKTLTADDVEELITAMLKAGKAADTVRNVVSVLSAILNYCRRRSMLSSNVTIGVRRPPVHRQVRRMPEGHQGALMKLLSHPKYRFRAVARLALLVRETGARPGEWVKVQWEDLDLAKNRVIFKHTKYKRMPRTVPLTKAAMALLTAQLEDITIVEFDRYAASDWVFPTLSREGDLVPIQYTGTLRDMKKEELIPRSLRAHNGRHEFISSLVEDSDLDDSRIMSLVGHHSPASMQIYTHARNVRFLPQLEALEGGRRRERMKEIAKSLGVPVALVDAYLQKVREDEDAGGLEIHSDELLYDGESIRTLQQAAEKLGTTESERMQTLMAIRARRGSPAKLGVAHKDEEDPLLHGELKHLGARPPRKQPVEHEPAPPSKAQPRKRPQEQG